MRHDGEGGSPRLIPTAMMAVTGALSFVAFLVEDLASVARADLPMGLIVRYVVAMCIGGALAGWLLAGLFGRHGIPGWLLALVGGIVATAVAGLLGSAVGLLPDLLADGWETADLIPIAFGLAVLPLAFAAQPVLLVGWLALLAVTHLWTRRARAVRRQER